MSLEVEIERVYVREASKPTSTPPMKSLIAHHTPSNLKYDLVVEARADPSATPGPYTLNFTAVALDGGAVDAANMNGAAALNFNLWTNTGSQLENLWERTIGPVAATMAGRMFKYYVTLVPGGGGTKPDGEESDDFIVLA